MTEIQELREKIVAEQATGCHNAGSYREVARNLGYDHLEVLNWTSSAGDWTFIISKDGFTWQIMSQSNNWPRAGFSYHVDEAKWYGTAEEVLEDIYDWYSQF